MEKNYSHPENSVNLKQLPPIDPSRIVNSSFKRRWSKSSTITAPKIGKPNFNRGLKFLKSDEALRKSNSGSSSSGKTSETQGNPTSDSDSAKSEGRKSKISLKFFYNKRMVLYNDGFCSPQILRLWQGMKQGSARSNLYEICSANHWKPPVFECCKEEGPSHQRKFTFKVIIEIEAGLKATIECFGSPHPKKKTAADHAAEGALWFLKHQDHVRKNK